MAKNHSKPKAWAVRDVRFVEVALTATTQQLSVEFDHGVGVVIAERSQIDLAADLIEHLRSTGSFVCLEGA